MDLEQNPRIGKPKKILGSLVKVLEAMGIRKPIFFRFIFNHQRPSYILKKAYREIEGHKLIQVSLMGHS